MKTDLSLKPFVIIDMMSGSYVLKKTGHECFNLDKNPVDGRYYGYCPPYGNIDITKLGAGKGDVSIDDVLVIYTKKVSGSSDREVIAFTESATVFHIGQINRKRPARHVYDFVGWPHNFAQFGKVCEVL